MQLLSTETISDIPFPTALVVVLALIIVLIIFLFPKNKGKAFLSTILLLAVVCVLAMVLLQYYGIIDLDIILWFMKLI